MERSKNRMSLSKKYFSRTPFGGSARQPASKYGGRQDLYELTSTNTATWISYFQWERETERDKERK